ncbi:MAG: endospore germination permease [Bacillota bacterium]
MRFSRVQMLFVLILFMWSSSHATLIPTLLNASKRDAWICILISYVILLFWGYLISLIISKNKQHESLYSWTKVHSNKFFAVLIISVFVLYILTAIFISFYQYLNFIKMYFLPLSSDWLIVIPSVLICIWAASKSLKSIVYCAAILLPIAIILRIFLTLTTIPEKDYAYLIPIWINGSHPIIQGTILILGAGFDLLILLLLQDKLKKSYSFLYVFILITIHTGFLLVSTIESISAFGPNVATIFRYPTYELWKLVNLGEYISHMDFLVVFQIISGYIVRVSLLLFLVRDLISLPVFLQKKMLYYLFSFFFLLFIGMFPFSDIVAQNIINKNYYPFGVILGASVTVFLLIISYLPIRR